MKIANYLLMVVFFLGTATLFGQFGTLDMSFGTDGNVLTEFGQYDSSVRCILKQPDGKIIAAGAVFNHSDYSRLALARYNSNGSLDTSFGSGGMVSSDFSESKMSLKNIALQDDGKILGSGIIYNNFTDSQFIIVRYNSNGTLDTSFGTDGVVIGDGISINAMLVQYDGKIVVSGFTSEDTGNRDFYLARYLEEGILDVDFGSGGVMTLSVALRDFSNAMVEQANGKIVFAGSSYNEDYSSDFVVVRCNNGGTLDTSFGVNGVVVIDSDDTDDASSVKIQSDGKILFSGYTSKIDGTLAKFNITRLLVNGSVDTGFGTDGMISGPGAAMAKALEIETDGKILAAGAFDDGSYNHASLTRYLVNGTTDPTFGTDGTVVTTVSTTGQANCLMLQDDGKIVVGGEAGLTGGSYIPDFTILRYSSGTQLEATTFNSNKNTFLAYPNPVNQNVTLDFTLGQAENLSVELYDVNGRKLSRLVAGKEFQAGYNSERMALPDSMERGIYFLKVSSGKDYSNVKIIK